MRTMILTKHRNCNSIESYINSSVIPAQMIKDIGSKVKDEFIWTFLLEGLPE